MNITTPEDYSTLFNLHNVESIRHMFAALYENKQFVVDKTGVPVIEILNASFVANAFSIFGLIDDDYLEKEIKWYKTMKQNINAMDPPVPSLWLSTANDKGETNSNYGWAIWHEDNFSQFDRVVNELTKNPYSRRAVMIYTAPDMWVRYKEDGKNDFMCTNNVQYLIRNNRLECLVYMRSNDAVFGYKCDRHWQIIVRDMVFRRLSDVYPGLQRGSIYWNVGSLHIYERHFYLVEAFLKSGNAYATKEEWQQLTNESSTREHTTGDSV